MKTLWTVVSIVGYGLILIRTFVLIEASDWSTFQKWLNAAGLFVGGVLAVTYLMEERPYR